jgi:DoxX-like family
MRCCGSVNLIGAVGLVLPPLAGIAAGLALAAATGLALIQVGAISLHLSRGEARLIGLSIALLALAGAAIWLSTIWP